MTSVISTPLLALFAGLLCTVVGPVAGLRKTQSKDEGPRKNPHLPRRRRPSVSTPFSQFRSTILQNSDLPPAADWASVPWSGTVSSIQHLSNANHQANANNGSNHPAYEYHGVFLVGVREDSEFWLVKDDLQHTPTPGDFTRLSGLQFFNDSKGGTPGYINRWSFLPYQGYSHIGGSYGKPEVSALVCQHYDASHGYDALYCGLFELISNIVQPETLFRVVNVSTVATQPGVAHPLRQMAIEYDTEKPANQFGFRAPKNLLFASKGGLTYIPFDGYDLTGLNPARVARRITLTNTTGGRTTNSNVTGVWCFPQWVPVSTFNDSARPYTFDSGQCYASSANQVSVPGGLCVPYSDPKPVCYPNLVHRVLDGRETYFYRTPGIIDRLPNGLCYDTQRNSVHMGNDKCLNILYANDSLWRVDGKTGGLPMNLIKSVASANSYQSATPGNGGEEEGEGEGMRTHVWYGTEKGVNLMQPDGTWKYFYGPRWLPVGPNSSSTTGNHVVALAVAPKQSNCTVGGCRPHTALVATRTGISFISDVSWSLEDKASAFQATHDKYHDRDGLSTLVHLSHWGNASSFIPHTTANDGLYTSVYLQGASFRYAVTKSAEAKAAAKKAFAGMKMLFTVTGIKGYPARNFVRSVQKPAFGGGGPWYNSTTMPGYWWASQTSSDEITGHMGVYAIYHDLVCESPEEKAEAAEVISNLVSHIVDHQLNLVGVDGKPTLWGRWNPEDVNNNPFYYDGRGLNCLEILMYLGSAYRITGNETYAAVFTELVEKHGYAESAIHSKITQVSDISYSDDRLNFISYIGLLWASNLVPRENPGQPGESSSRGSARVNKLFAKVQYDVLVSIQRTFHYKQIYQMRHSWWTTIYAAFQKVVAPGGLSAEEEAFLMGPETGALFCLQTWPTSWITWPTDNSQRLDIVLNPHFSSSVWLERQEMEGILPYDEIAFLQVSANPYLLRSGTTAHSQKDPSGWLTPYWTARFFGLLDE